MCRESSSGPPAARCERRPVDSCQWAPGPAATVGPCCSFSSSAGARCWTSLQKGRAGSIAADSQTDVMWIQTVKKSHINSKSWLEFCQRVSNWFRILKSQPLWIIQLWHWATARSSGHGWHWTLQTNALRRMCTKHESPLHRCYVPLPSHEAAPELSLSFCEDTIKKERSPVGLRGYLNSILHSLSHVSFSARPSLILSIIWKRGVTIPSLQVLWSYRGERKPTKTRQVNSNCTSSRLEAGAAPMTSDPFHI